MGVMDFSDEMSEGPETDIRDGLAEMAENDLDHPYQAFRLALVNSGISDEARESVMTALSEQITLYHADQREWVKKVYNA